MPKDNRNKRKRPPTVAEAQRALESAMRREAAAANTKPRRVDLANLDTPDVTHAEQYAEFLNRPGRFYVGQFDIALDDEPLGQKLTTQTTFKADDQQLLYLVEVLRQVRGALGAHTRITLAPAEPHVEERRLAGPARVTTTTPDGVTRIHEMSRAVARQHAVEKAEVEAGKAAERAARARIAARTGVYPEPAGAVVREWCCGTPITDPHIAGCAFEPRADNPVDYTGPARVATAEELAAVREMRARAEARNGFTLPPPNGHHGAGAGGSTGQWANVQPPERDLTREELTDMLPGQTRAEVAQELGKAPENLGGTVHNADVMPEELAAELGVPVESLQRIAIQGGGYAWAVKPAPEQAAGRHAAPDGDDQ